MPTSRCRSLAIWRCSLAAALLTVCAVPSSQAQPKAQQTSAPATRGGAALPAPAATGGKLCPVPPPCGNTCSNTPFVPTECWTTQYGPAKADVVVKPTNMLYCNGGTYALCFFSGPPSPTGQNPANKSLPCTAKGNFADCTCQAYTSGAYFVDINGILNEGAFYQTQTVSVCGHDGAKCANLETCGPTGQASNCGNLPQAPVCQYVKNQNRKNPTASLIPASDLISAFSFAMDKDYRQGSTPCTGPYAGCMTAGCAYGPNHRSPTVDGELVQCQCPIANGNFQIGQSHQTCAIAGSGQTSYLWSASYTPGAATAPAGKNQQ